MSWVNKELRLISQGNSYEWVLPGDHRVAEVRLLDQITTVGDTTKAGENLLIEGDALHGLTALTDLPALGAKYLGKVKLCYIDPPFNTGQAFAQYDDALEHSVWLTMMRDRLTQVKKLLSPSGSVWVHLDDAEMAYARVLLDEVFGRQNFVATVVWQKTLTRRNDAKGFSVAQDYILVFAKDKSQLSVNPIAATDKQRSTYTNRDADPRGDWLAVPLHAPGARGPQLSYPITLPSGRTVQGPPSGRHWASPKAKFDELVADGRVWFGKEGDGMPQRKKFWSEGSASAVPWTWWPYEEVGENREAKKEIKDLFPALTAFATPKPERFLERVIAIGSSPGDIVLDCFAGSGTTAAVAHKMGRRWVTIEREADTVKNFITPRLAKVVEGLDAGGVSAALNWAGGSGFTHLKTRESMFVEEDGELYLAEWAVAGELGAAVAAQLGFQADAAPPFVGRRGRTRLAMVDGLLTVQLVDLLVAALGPKESVKIAATALDPAARERLRSVSPGSTITTVPGDVILSFESRTSERVRTTYGPSLDSMSASLPDARDLL